MKIFLRIAVVLLIFAGCTKKDAERMVFLTTAYKKDWPKRSDLTEKELKDSLNDIICELKISQIKTIIFQVRPHAGTFYKSQFEPMSSFLSVSDVEFDVLDYLSEACTKKKMNLYAWVNPFRVSVGENDAYLANLFIEKHPDWLLKNNNGYFLNPGVPAVRQYVVNLVREIVDNYKVDAVLFDDYFYPAEEQGYKILDKSTFLANNNSNLNIEDWRRENITSLIKACHFRCKEKNVKFIVSPAGIWRNSTNDSAGSNSDGLSSYDDLYADTKLWCEKGYVDMILPQLYYKQGQKGTDFAEMADWWSKNKGQAELGFALAAYKVSEKNWDKEELDKQIEYIGRKLKCRNIAFYNTSAYLEFY